MTIEIVTHRGRRHDICENTYAALDGVLELGRTGMEIDVHLTADGAILVHHDHFLAPDKTRHKRNHAMILPGSTLEQMTLNELREFEVVYSLDPDGEPVSWGPIPELSELLDRWSVEAAGQRLFVELKNSPEFNETRTNPEPLAEAATLLIAERKLQDRAVLLAFDWVGLMHAKSVNPDVLRYHLGFPLGAPRPTISDRNRDMLKRIQTNKSIWCGSFDPDILGCSMPEAVARAGGAGWAPWHTDADAATIEAAKIAGIEVLPWMAETPEAIERVVSLGVDTVITDNAEFALAVVEGSE